VSSNSPAAVVIGGGFGGMAAALRLRAKGYRVTLVERLDALGGRAQSYSYGDFKHDAGPTVLTAPHLFEELFSLFRRRIDDYATLAPLETWYRFRFDDASIFNYGGPLEKTLDAIHDYAPADVDGYRRLLDHSRRLFDTAFTQLSSVPFDSIWTMLSQGPLLAKLRAHKSVGQMVAHFIRDPNLRQAFSIQPLLVGGNPFSTTSIYMLIHYLEQKWGVHYAVGGTSALVAAIARLIEEAGIEVVLSETAERIDVDAGGSVSGVVLASGKRLPASIVVSNCDPIHLYAHMLPRSAVGIGARLKQRARLSMGLFVLYFGTRRLHPEVARHTILLGQGFRQHLDEIFNQGRIGEDISLYLHRPTANDPSFAPAGADSFYALCPVPNLAAGIDWSIEAPRLRSKIIERLARTVLPDLPETIVADFYVTPADFEKNYLSTAGSGFSIAPIFTQSAWFRFHNRAEGPKGLFLTGAGTHPGAGIPGVLCSAKVIDALVPAV
jgi:phytoene desaturase